jgi:hypothetical protein
MDVKSLSKRAVGEEREQPCWVPAPSASLRVTCRSVSCCGETRGRSLGRSFITGIKSTSTRVLVRVYQDRLRDWRRRSVSVHPYGAAETPEMTSETPPSEEAAAAASSGAPVGSGAQEGPESLPGNVVKRGPPRRSERCPGCLARGKLRCDLCSGAGHVGGVCCELCFGLGKIRCSQCGGTGFIFKEGN